LEPVFFAKPLTLLRNMLKVFDLEHVVFAKPLTLLRNMLKKAPENRGFVFARG
jgi:hypothetical protein